MSGEKITRSKAVFCLLLRYFPSMICEELNIFFSHPQSVAVFILGLPVRVLLVRVLLVQSSPAQSSKYHMPKQLALMPGQTINVWRPDTIIKHCLMDKHFTDWTPCLVLFDRV